MLDFFFAFSSIVAFLFFVYFLTISLFGSYFLEFFSAFFHNICDSTENADVLGRTCKNLATWKGRGGKKMGKKLGKNWAIEGVFSLFSLFAARGDRDFFSFFFFFFIPLEVYDYNSTIHHITNERKNNNCDQF